MLRFILSLIFLMPITCYASENSWNEIKKLEITYQILSAVDTAETLYFLHHGTAKELNPLLGSNPSPGKVIVFKTITGVLHYAVTCNIYEYNPEYAKYFEYTSIAVQGTVVTLNLRFIF